MASKKPVAPKRARVNKNELPKVRAIGTGLDVVVGTTKTIGIGLGVGAKNLVLGTGRGIGTFFKEVNEGRKNHKAQRLAIGG